jgi:hypothetical protein
VQAFLTALSQTQMVDLTLDEFVSSERISEEIVFFSAPSDLSSTLGAERLQSC